MIVLDGGRPKGSTALLVAAFTRGAETAGHTVETVSLMKNEVKGGLGCNACRYGKPCVQRDVTGGGKRLAFPLSCDTILDDVCAFEAFIDLMRRFMLHGLPMSHVIALCGLYDGSLETYLILFLERKSIKKNFNNALQTVAIPGFSHGNDIALLIGE